MDATRMLKADHDKVKELFERFEQAADGEKQGIADQIISELKTHTELEEQIFYPAVTQAGDTYEELVREGLEEHHVADTIIAEIEAMSPDDEQFEAKVTVLQESVEHHIEEEEGEMFPGLQRDLGKERLEALGEQMARAKGLDPASADVLVDLTKEELYAKAQELDISGRSDMSKDELIDAIRATAG